MQRYGVTSIRLFVANHDIDQHRNQSRFLQFAECLGCNAAAGQFQLDVSHLTGKPFLVQLGAAVAAGLKRGTAVVDLRRRIADRGRGTWAEKRTSAQTREK